MNEQMVIRPVREEDLKELLSLAEAAAGALTNLPNDPEFLRERAGESIHSFDPRVRRAGDHRYLFVLEDSAAGRLAGISGIISKIGGFQPWYSYQIRRERHAFEPLGIDHEVTALCPQADYNGPSEICCLFLRREYRKGGLGRLLSLSRFHFMAEFSRRFDREVIAELRGVTDDSGHSPFWDAVGRKFFQMDFARADALSGLQDNEFIARLLPKHPLYAALLQAEAREVIGRPHREAEPALKMLLSEGFRFSNEVDIFDAGPLVVAELGNVRTVRDRRKAPVIEVAPKVEGDLYLLSNLRLDFRAAIASLGFNADGSLIVPESAAAKLEVKQGDLIAFSPLRPPHAGPDETVHSMAAPYRA